MFRKLKQDFRSLLGHVTMPVPSVSNATIMLLPPQTLLGVWLFPALIASATMSGVNMSHGALQLPNIQVANASITFPADTMSATLTIPMTATASLTGLPSAITIPITMPQVVIYTTQTQLRLPTNLPFVLGTIPNAQPLLGVSFILGTNAPGEVGGVALTSAESVCDAGSLEASIPPSLE